MLRAARFIPRLAGLCVLIVVGAGCTVVLDHPVAVKSYSPREKINLTVALQISEELRTAQWEKSSVIIPFGEHLVRNSETLARAIFSTVVLKDGSPASPEVQVDAVLIPRMVFVEHRYGIWKWDDSVITMGLEWSLRDRKGNPIWVDTVQGEGKTETGNAFTGRTRMRERAGLVVDDVFQKSFETMVSAQAIREFARLHSGGR